MTQGTDDISIETEEAAPAKIGDFVIWSSGLPVMVPDAKKGGYKSSNVLYKGFLFPVGKEEETDLDRVCIAAEWNKVYIKHTNSVEAHWQAPEALALLILTKALPDFKGISGDDRKVANNEPVIRKGIAYGWMPVRNRDTGEMVWKGAKPKNATFLLFKAFLPELAMYGYDQPLTFTFKGMMTNNVVEAFQQHLENQKELLLIPEAKAAIVAVHAELAENGFDRPTGFPFYGSYMTFGYVGDEPFKGENGAERESGVVGLLQNDEATDRTEWLTLQVASAYERSLCMNAIDEAILWSVDLTKRRLTLSEDELRQVAEQRLATRGALA